MISINHLVFHWTHCWLAFAWITGILTFPASDGVGESFGERKLEKVDVDPIEYLQNFGWLEFSSDTKSVDIVLSLKSENVINALKNFQGFAGIVESGLLDPATLRMMTLPRCGESDTSNTDDAEVVTVPRTRKGSSKGLSRRKRFVLQGTRWRSRELKYNISKYTKDLPPSEVDDIISAAFRQWENVANVSFFRANAGKIHLDIRFEKRYHGDEETFDGPGGTTAHAYFPVYGGSVHFDDDENWTHNSDWGVNLYQVATHEIGHALGLEHSDVQESVMSPFYRTFKKDFKLHQDDIEAIQALYGKRVLTICDDAKVDAATTMIDGNTYIFKGIYVYLLTNADEMATDSPTAISVAFPGLPNNLDAAITRSNGVSYFFKGSEFWRVTNMRVDLEDGFPKPVSEYFPGIPIPIDAAFVFSKDGNIYFFQNSTYWEFNHRLNSVDNPKPIYNWSGIPENGLDAVVSLEDSVGNNFTYFFKDNLFWKFNDKSGSVFLSDPPYPKRVSTQLFGCRM